MSTATDSKPNPAAAGPRYRLGVNAYDRVSSLLVALLVLIGTTVAVLLIVFLFRRFSPDVVPPTLERIYKPRGEPPKGYEDDIEPPGLEDAPKDLPPQLQDTLKELTNAITSKTAMLSNENFSADQAAGYGTGKGNKNYDGDGSGEGGNDPPKELRFEASSDIDYARMIDYFEGELAVLDTRENKVYYATNLAQAKPTTREGAPGDDKRFYFRATGPPLAPIEVKLARKAGIMRPNAYIVVFYPDKVAQDIYAKEEAIMRKNGRKALEDIDRTVFRVNKEGRAYEFTVEDQTYF